MYLITCTTCNKLFTSKYVANKIENKVQKIYYSSSDPHLHLYRQFSFVEPLWQAWSRRLDASFSFSSSFQNRPFWEVLIERSLSDNNYRPEPLRDIASDILLLTLHWSFCYIALLQLWNLYIQTVWNHWVSLGKIIITMFRSNWVMHNSLQLKLENGNVC